MNKKKQNLKKQKSLLYHFLLIILSISILTFNPYDSSLTAINSNQNISNWMGNIGSVISSIIFIIFGQGAYLYGVYIIIITISKFFFKKDIFQKKQILGITLSVTLYSYILILLTKNQSFNAGGILAGLLIKFLNITGGIIGVFIGSIALILGIIYSFSKRKFSSILKIKKLFQSKKKYPLIEKILFKNQQNKNNINYSVLTNPLIQNILLSMQKARINTIAKSKNKEAKVKTEIKNPKNKNKDNIIKKEKTQENNIKSINEIEIKLLENQKKENNKIPKTIKISNTNLKIDKIKTETQSIKIENQTLISPNQINIKKKLEDSKNYKENFNDNFSDNINKNFNENNNKKEIIIKTEIKNKTNIKQQFNHLSQSSQQISEGIYEKEQNTAEKLKLTLEEFNIEAKIINITRGPVITCYEVELAKGIRVSKLINLQDNIALTLASQNIRIISPIPGKSAIGIEIPNINRDMVKFGDIIQSNTLKTTNKELPLILGKGMSGKIVIADLSQLPHLLIAGATGMGKSVFLNSLIAGLLYTKTPAEMRFIMIDPKRVELKMYDNIPYLLTPVITEAKKALQALKWASSEMERRYSILEECKCRNIKNYYEKRKESKINYEFLEYIVIIIDEFADLILVSGKEVEEQIARLAAMSRAVGIHLVIATQRPSADIITGLIKANFPARVAFQVSSKTESRIILDTNGAEKLLGKGDLLFTAPAIAHLERIQGAFLSEDEVHQLSLKMQNIMKANYKKELDFNNENISNKLITNDKDELYHEAVEIILLEKRASASYLQRKMKIGYNRAARIIELMEDEGIISESNGSKPREILIESYNRK